MSQESENNCPFYGYAMFQTGLVGGPRPVQFLSSGGNQCAIVTTSHAPCRMEIDGEVPDWKKCAVLRDVQMGMGT